MLKLSAMNVRQRMGSKEGYLKLIAKDPDHMRKIGRLGGLKKVKKGFAMKGKNERQN